MEPEKTWRSFAPQAWIRTALFVCAAHGLGSVGMLAYLIRLPARAGAVAASAALTGAELLLCALLYSLLLRRLTNAQNRFSRVYQAFACGDTTRRVREEDCGPWRQLAEGFNRMADAISSRIRSLETELEQRSRALDQAAERSAQEEYRLLQLLDSAAEAIYSIDAQGACTFCNSSCLKLLRYGSRDDLLGTNIHRKIHYSLPDGTPLIPEECPILQAIAQGRTMEGGEEVFWRADGTPLAVEYRAYPQIRDGKIIGGIVTFLDTTERKKRDEEIRYLSNYDILTGLMNRRCFDETRAALDRPENYPLSVIFTDINGLKLTNDIFGHAVGDALIKKSSEILRASCRRTDVIARMGGDEFIILLPRTSREEAENVIERICSGFSSERISAVKCSIAVGLDTKRTSAESLEDVIANAENAMYKDKITLRKSVNRGMIDTLIETLHARSPEEGRHSVAVSELCGEIGTALRLSKPVVNKLKRAGYLHDIGKIVVSEDILIRKYGLSADEEASMRQHSVVGYRILNLFDDTLDLAEDIYSHHEWWDGTGYPRELKGEEIPLLSRIISVAEVYERILHIGDLPPEEKRQRAIEALRSSAGKRLDPQIVEVFLQMMERKGEGKGA